MKFSCKNEMENLSFDDSPIKELKIEEKKIEFVFDSAVIKADNSQNGRFQDMFCGEIVLQLQNAQIMRVMKEGMRYYDANGVLKNSIPDEDIPAPGQQAILKRLAKGTVFTVVSAEMKKGYGYEFGIDVCREEDEEESDTFWLCVTCDKTVTMWERYCSPVEEG